MDLASLEIKLRPRSPWEAIDLGFALARRWFVPLAGLWLMTALPVALLASLLFSDEMIALSVLIWWCKPLYEPALVFWLSRAVFGERLPLKGIARGWWRIVRPQLFANLTWRRLSSNRSFYMPVALLEGLKGKERRERTAVLGRRQQAGTWLTIVGFHFETLLEICFILTLYFLIPEELRWFEGEEFFFSPGPIDEWLQLLCWLGAMALIAPFYVAGGFALYLHRRSELEGWDIEIGFRRTTENLLAERKKPLAGSAVAGIALLLCVMLGSPDSVLAAEAPGPEQSRQSIEKILDGPKFGEMEEQTRWRYVGETETAEEDADTGWFEALLKVLAKIIGGFLAGTASVVEIILWIAASLIVAYLLYHLSRNRNWMQGIPLSSAKRRNTLPGELFGLDVRPESLPDDIAAEALRQLHEGDLRGALSLLYRGALMRLVSEHQLEIPDSATEGECLTLVREHRKSDEAHYFSGLTDAWLVTAYGHHSPDAGHIEQLCHDWQQVFGHVER